MSLFIIHMIFILFNSKVSGRSRFSCRASDWSLYLSRQLPYITIHAPVSVSYRVWFVWAADANVIRALVSFGRGNDASLVQTHGSCRVRRSEMVEQFSRQVISAETACIGIGQGRLSWIRAQLSCRNLQAELISLRDSSIIPLIYRIRSTRRKKRATISDEQITFWTSARAIDLTNSRKRRCLFSSEVQSIR